MSHDVDPFIEFLAQKENFRTALETARRIDAVRVYIQRTFMMKLEEAARVRLEPEMAAGWKLKNWETGDKKILPGICLLPPNVETPRYVFRIEHNNDFHHGVFAWRTSFTSSEIEKHAGVAQTLRGQDFLPAYKWWWVGHKYSWQRDEDLDSMLTKIVERGDDVLNGVLEKALEDFRVLLMPLIVELNSQSGEVKTEASPSIVDTAI